MFLLMCTGTLYVWFGEFKLLLPLHHDLLVDLGDDDGGEPCGSSDCAPGFFTADRICSSVPQTILHSTSTVFVIIYFTFMYCFSKYIIWF